MHFFNRKETTFIVSVLVFIFLVSYVSYLASLRRTRDIERNYDVSNLFAAIVKYKTDFGFYPPSTDNGEILACYIENENIDYGKAKRLLIKDKMAHFNFLKENSRVCKWGVDSLNDLADLNYPAYITLIPKDPKHIEGRRYYYNSDGESFKLYAAYEGKSVESFNQKIVNKNIACGSAVCNFGKVLE